MKDLVGLAVFALLVVALIVGLTWVLPSAMEAKAYNNATGSNVSTWDAMWVELRVQSAPKAHNNGGK